MSSAVSGLGSVLKSCLLVPTNKATQPDLSSIGGWKQQAGRESDLHCSPGKPDIETIKVEAGAAHTSQIKSVSCVMFRPHDEARIRRLRDLRCRANLMQHQSRSPPHLTDHLLMRIPLPAHFAQRLYTPQVTYDIFRLPEVHLLQ